MGEQHYSQYSVLLVDDEPFIRGFVRLLLVEMGFEKFKEADNGQEALAIIDNIDVPIDLMLCDLMMPDMDGIEVIRHLSARVTRPAIAFLSGTDDAVLKAACSLAKARRLHVLGSISKPVDKAQLVKLLKVLEYEYTPKAKRDLPTITTDDLARGIAASELFFHYQPKVSIKDQQLAGVEALVRWQHPELGVVNPDAFIELAETGIPEDEALYMEIVTRLHMQGFAIAIDDFGTGQSSLLKLEALPFSELKIDRAFVNGASHDTTKRAILEASIGLAKSLNMEVVAEGVEEKADWDMLARLNCDLVQGYYVARPMSANEFEI